MKTIYALLCIFLLTAPSVALAQKKVSAPKGQTDKQAEEKSASSLSKPDSSVPTKITSDDMAYDANKQVVVFSKNVTVNRPDFRITAQKLTVYMEKGEKKSEFAGMGAGDIERIVAEGNVRITRESKVGTCQKLTYNMKDDTLLMEGKPVLVDGKNSIAGAVIRHHIGANKSEVLGGKNQVEAVFSSDSETKGKP